MFTLTLYAEKGSTFAQMVDVAAYINSGIVENYCLGFCTAEEVISIENLALQNVEIKHEIEKVRLSLEQDLLLKAVPPAASVKVSLMKAIYKQEAVVQHKFAPLIDDTIAGEDLQKWVADHIPAPELNQDDMLVIELPSTDQVINFAAVAKSGHAEEMHTDFIEYLYIIKGSCMMKFNGIDKSYKEGEIITIHPNTRHAATVTSEQPMFVLVQRQLCA